MVGDMRSHTRPAAPEQTGKHAAPTELGGHLDTCGYKHGAPNGAFRVVVAAPLGLKNACKVREDGSFPLNRCARRGYPSLDFEKEQGGMRRTTSSDSR